MIYAILAAVAIVAVVALTRGRNAPNQAPAQAGAPAPARTTTNTWSRVLLLWLRARMRPQPTTTTADGPGPIEKIIAAILAAIALYYMMSSSWFGGKDGIVKMGIVIAQMITSYGLWALYIETSGKWPKRFAYTFITTVLLATVAILVWQLIPNTAAEIVNENGGKEQWPGMRNYFVLQFKAPILAASHVFFGWVRNLSGEQVIALFVLIAALKSPTWRKLVWVGLMLWSIWAFLPEETRKSIGEAVPEVYGLNVATWLLLFVASLGALSYLVSKNQDTAPAASSAGANNPATTGGTTSAPAAAPNKTSSLSALVPLLVLALAGGGVYYFYQQQKSPPETAYQAAECSTSSVGGPICTEFRFSCEQSLCDNALSCGRTWSIKDEGQRIAWRTAQPTAELLDKIAGKRLDEVFKIEGDRGRISQNLRAMPYRRGATGFVVKGSPFYTLSVKQGVDISFTLRDQYCR